MAGLVFNTASLTAYYHRDTDTTATAITLATMTVGTFTSSGFKEIDATNMPGWYQFCPPNAAIATGAKSCALHLKGATNMAPLPIEVDLQGDANVTHWLGTAAPASSTAGTPVVDVGRINNVSTSAVTTVKAVQGIAVDGVITTVGSVAAGGITAASFGASAIDAAALAPDAGTEIGTAVWASVTRTLTAGTNIVLAKGVGVTGFNDIAATAIVSAGAITTSGGKVSGVILVDTTTTNTDMRGTDNAALAATALSTATWTGARAGYLDNVNNATLGAASFPTDPADESLIIAATDAIMTRIGAPSGASVVADIATRLATSGYTSPPSAAANAAAVAAIDVAGKTLQESVRIIGAATAGKTTGGGTLTEIGYDFAGVLTVTWSLTRVTTDITNEVCFERTGVAFA